MSRTAPEPLVVRRSPRRLLVKTGTVPLAFASLGAVFGLFDPEAILEAFGRYVFVQDDR